MKTNIIILALLSLLYFGCDDRNHIFSIDTTPPMAPTGVIADNGDGYAIISWEPNRENDLGGYKIYVSDSYSGKYSLIGSTQKTSFTDSRALNGRRYYYAVAAYDIDGNEGDLSREYAYAVPRPEGFDVTMWEWHDNPRNAGFSFSQAKIVPFNAQSADVFFETYNNRLYLSVWNYGRILDKGPTRDIYDIIYAPVQSMKDTMQVAIIGHTYIIETYEGNYAKLRIYDIKGGYVKFDWSYQTIAGEPMLKQNKNKPKRSSYIYDRSLLAKMAGLPSVLGLEEAAKQNTEK